MNPARSGYPPRGGGCCDGNIESATTPPLSAHFSITIDTVRYGKLFMIVLTLLLNRESSAQHIDPGASLRAFKDGVNHQRCLVPVAEGRKGLR